MKRILAALIIGPLCALGAQAETMTKHQMCDRMGPTAKSQTVVYRDTPSLALTKKEYILNRQRSVMESEEVADEKKIPLLKIYSLLGDLIWGRYEMMIPELIEVQFAEDCKKEGWDLSAFF